MSEKSDCRNTRERIHDYLDGELGEKAHVECEQHVTRCDECRSVLVEYRSVKSAVAKKATRRAAPPSLAVRVRQGIESSARPGFWESLRAVTFRRSVAVGAVFAVILFVFWIFPHDRGAYVVAEEVTRQCFDGHDRCARSPLLSEHVFTHDPAVLARVLSVRTGHDVSVPDLSAAGCTLVEGHVCSVLGEPAIHIYYEDAEGELVSLFRIAGIEEKGALGEKVEVGVDAYVPPHECWESELQQGMHVLIWRSGPECVSILLGHEPQAEIEDLVGSCSPGGDSETL